MFGSNPAAGIFHEIRIARRGLRSRSNRSAGGSVSAEAFSNRLLTARPRSISSAKTVCLAAAANRQLLFLRDRFVKCRDLLDAPRGHQRWCAAKWPSAASRSGEEEKVIDDMSEVLAFGDGGFNYRAIFLGVAGTGQRYFRFAADISDAACEARARDRRRIARGARKNFSSRSSMSSKASASGWSSRGQPKAVTRSWSCFGPTRFRACVISPSGRKPRLVTVRAITTEAARPSATRTATRASRNVS